MEKDLKAIRTHLSYATDSIMTSPDHVLVLLWERFSEIQAASWIAEDKESCERFYAWYCSGNDDDARS